MSCSVRKYSQGAKSKDNHQGDLSFQGHLRAIDGIHGKCQDHEIGRDRKPSIGIPVICDTDTTACNALIPGARDRRALEDGCKKRRHHIGRNDHQENVTNDAKPSLNENSQVEQENRHLRKIHCELIESLAHEEKLVLSMLADTSLRGFYSCILRWFDQTILPG